MAGKWRSWLSGAGRIVLLAIAAFACVQCGGPNLVPVPPASGARPIIAGQITVEPASPATGQSVTAQVTISADRAVVLQSLTVKVRDASGAFYDFPALVNVNVGTTPREIELRREFDSSGDYTYYLAYQLNGGWGSLPPWYGLTVH